MPYILEKWPTGYIVVSKDTGFHHSLKPIPKERAEAQKRLLETVYSKENRRKGSK